MTSNLARVELGAEQVALIKRSLCPDLTDNEIALFIEVAKRSGLDPIRKQIYAIKRGGRVTFQTAIDGFRVIAERSGKYAGQTPTYWCGADGIWVDAWLTDKPPVAAKVGVHRTDFKEPVWAVARFASYAGDNLWRKMPELMIGKCAEALALRKAFPELIGGLYTADEMQQADSAPPQQITADGEIVSQIERSLQPNAEDYLHRIEAAAGDSALLRQLSDTIGHLKDGFTLDDLADMRSALKKARAFRPAADMGPLEVGHDPGGLGPTAPVTQPVTAADVRAAQRAREHRERQPGEEG